MRGTPLRLSLAGVTIGLLLTAYERIPSAEIMSEASQALAASLEESQRAKLQAAFDDPERFNWHYIPRERKGLPFYEMTAEQRHLAQALLSAGLSQRGAIKASTIMSLEEVLRVLEKDDGRRRNPQGYFFTLFGQPGGQGPWGYRVEGHHISLNFTIAGGRVSVSPSFLGANPAEVRHGPRKGLRALAREEDLGRQLIHALDNEQRKVAVVSPAAYKDILSAASRKAAVEGQPSGLSAARMSASQREILEALAAEYAGLPAEDGAAVRREQVRKAGDRLFFAWAGTTEKGGPHYYRIQSPEFLIEYDNTQNDANHIHSVWRDFQGDFGLDLLARHYNSSRH